MSNLSHKLDVWLLAPYLPGYLAANINYLLITKAPSRCRAYKPPGVEFVKMTALPGFAWVEIIYVSTKMKGKTYKTFPILNFENKLEYIVPKIYTLHKLNRTKLISKYFPN